MSSIKKIIVCFFLLTRCAKSGNSLVIEMNVLKLIFFRIGFRTVPEYVEKKLIEIIKKNLSGIGVAFINVQEWR